MGYPVKLQKVERPSNRSYYLNFPMVLAETLGLQKGEVLEWSVQDKNTFILKRKRTRSARKNG
jgi:bifunctional DNA-binding transcriptional regulator/antitoxin component of YhaV-PrlF toxin-antitoxin module